MFSKDKDDEDLSCAGVTIQAVRLHGLLCSWFLLRWILRWTNALSLLCFASTIQLVTLYKNILFSKDYIVLQVLRIHKQ